jgi:hypothetical protein
MSEQPFATFMIKLNDVVAGIRSIIDCDLRAPLSKGLDDLSSLRLSASRRRSRKCAI